MKRFGTAALAVALGLGGVGAALAQGIVTDPVEIKACLCSEQAVARLKDRVSQAQQTYDQDHAAVDTLDQQIAQARASVNTAIQGQVDALKAMNLQREQLYAHTYDVDLPALQAAIQAYNDAAGEYGARCVGRNFDSVLMDQGRANLFCPPLLPPPD
jgi:hypothetical protein